MECFAGFDPFNGRHGPAGWITCQRVVLYHAAAAMSTPVLSFCPEYENFSAMTSAMAHLREVFPFIRDGASVCGFFIHPQWRICVRFFYSSAMAHLREVFLFICNGASVCGFFIHPQWRICVRFFHSSAMAHLREVFPFIRNGASA